MPNLAEFKLPEGAREEIEKKAASAPDPYADLTDEERVEEGIPPKGAPAPAAAEPEKKAEAAPEPEKSPEKPVADPEEDERVASLQEDINALSEQLAEAMKREPEPEAKQKGDPLQALIDRALESEHDETRDLAEALKATRQEHAALAERLERAEKREEARVQNDQRRQDNRDFKKVMGDYQIDGKPLTLEHRDKVEVWMQKHPNTAAELSIEQCTRLALPEVVKANGTPAPKTSAAKTPAATDQPPTATIVDPGSSGGAPPASWKPQAGDDMQSAMHAAGKRFGWVK